MFTTTITRGHYGLHAQTIIDGHLFSTMRVHSKKIVTSVNRILSQKPDVIVSEPTNVRAVHGPVRILRPETLQAIHENHVQQLLLSHPLPL